MPQTLWGWIRYDDEERMNYNHFTVTHFKDGSVGADHQRDNWATITPFTAAIIIMLGGSRLFEVKDRADNIIYRGCLPAGSAVVLGQLTSDMITYAPAYETDGPSAMFVGRAVEAGMSWENARKVVERQRTQYTKNHTPHVSTDPHRSP